MYDGFIGKGVALTASQHPQSHDNGDMETFLKVAATTNLFGDPIRVPVCLGMNVSIRIIHASISILFILIINIRTIHLTYIKSNVFMERGIV